MGLLKSLLSLLAVLVAVLVVRPPPWSFPPNRYLEDPVFAPVVAELSDQLRLASVGRIPAHLHGGVFLRNGANPIDRSCQPYHWFDGDGMIFQAAIVNASAIVLRNRWIRTATLAHRNASGMTSFLAEIQHPFRAVKAIARLSWSNYWGTTAWASTGNTALMYWRNRLYALMEAALPVQVDPETLETASDLSTLNGALQSSLTAHPKYDADSDELVAFGYMPPGSSLSYYVFRGSDGKAVHSSKIDFGEQTASSQYWRMFHDFAITDNYSIFYDSPAQRLHPGSLLHMPLPPDPIPSRLVWVERHSNITHSAPVSLGSVFHYVNAWEDGSKVVLVGCRSSQKKFYLDIQYHIPYLHEWVIDLKTGTATEKPLLSGGNRIAMEFPQINARKTRKRMRFVYGMAFAPDDAESVGVGIVKYDYETGAVQRYSFGKDCYGQEPQFVHDPAPDAPEDSGSLITFVFDRATNSSSLYIIDAAKMTPAAIIPLATRVPMGFHTLFLSAEQLKKKEPLE